MRFLVPALVLLSLVAGCGRGAGPGQEWPAGRTFVSTAVEGHHLPEITRISLAFRNGEVAASGGCNHLRGAASREGDRLVVDELEGTAMACADELMALDSWLSRFLTSKPTMRLDGDDLTLRRKETILTLSDETVAHHDSELRGTRWQVDTLVDGDVASSLPSGVRAYLTFSTENKVGGYGGCNRIGGDAESDASTVTFTNIAATRKSCGKDADQVEQAVLAVLRGTVEYRITGDALTVTHPSGHALRLRAE